MNRTDPAGADPRTVLDDYPVFDAEYYFDDSESPTTVTICTAESRGLLATEWISCRASHAVPIESVR